MLKNIQVYSCAYCTQTCRNQLIKNWTKVLTAVSEQMVEITCSKRNKVQAKLYLCSKNTHQICYVVSAEIIFVKFVTNVILACIL